MTIFNGWLFDVYPNEENMTVWVIGEDGTRRRLTHNFAARFYAAGKPSRLRALWRWLKMEGAKNGQVKDQPLLSRTMRRDVFQGFITVLSVEVLRPAKLDELFRKAAEAFPDLTFYDADISLSLRYAAAFGVFPLSHCRVEAREDKIENITPLDTPWEIEPELVPLRILSLEPNCDPAHAEPKGIVFTYGKVRYVQPLEPATALLANLRSVLKLYDPDLIQTTWGDTWVMPTLMELSRKLGIPLPFNREAGMEVVERKEHTYFSYGQIVYRGRQMQLLGRWHVDSQNAMLWSDYGLTGVLEMARVTRQPVQEAARLSPGTGISSMQFVTALQNEILIPWHKHQAETPKTAMELMQSDMGGMIYQPTVGLHRDVAGIDFVSMYPGIMVRFNISPEVPRAGNALEPAPGEPGIVPMTLAPLLEKRLSLKSALASMSRWDCRRPVYQAMASAEKWLLVTCFGYLGYKNARFGRIEAHEAVTAYGREALLRAKEAAEEQGFTILHMYVDGLWVKRDGCKAPEDFESLLEEIIKRTGLPIALDGVYRWVAFLPSRVDERVPVPNQYFGVFQDGTIKVRGIECRRRDSAPFIAEMQMALMKILAEAQDAEQLKAVLPKARAYIRKQVEALRTGKVPAEKLLVSQKLSRELGEYSSPSPAARAVRELQKAGKIVRPGQRVRFLFTLGSPGVRAWDVPDRPDLRMVDVKRYQTLLERAAQSVLAPIQKSVNGGEEPPSLFTNESAFVESHQP
jgi:DNA polymerase II